MNEQLTKEVLSRLDVMAAKLGVASGEVWRVLVAQARVEGITLLLQACCLATLVFIWWKVFRPKFESDDWDHEGWQVIGLVAGIVLAGCVAGMVVGGVPLMVTAVVNPEYLALKQIAALLK